MINDRELFLYKHFYPAIREGKGKEGEKRDDRRGNGWKTRGRQRITGQAGRNFRGREPGDALPAP